MQNANESTESDQEISNKIAEYFRKSCEVFKSLGDYKHLIFSTGIGDNTMFNIDPNIGEFTVDAFRIGIMIYMYYFPNLNFPHELLSVEADGTVFTFANNKFHYLVVEHIRNHVKSNNEFVLPFLPRSNSSHWYTLCIQPNKNRIVILNPLYYTNQEEEQFLINIGNTLSSILDCNYVVFVENAGLQNSCMSCGENSLMITLALLTNSEEGYVNLVKYFRGDFMVNSFLDIYDISLNKKCLCVNCTDNSKNLKIIAEQYKLCIMCNVQFGGAIGINNIESQKCVYCDELFTESNHKIITINKSLNKQKSEIALRTEILKVLELGSIENLRNGCNLSEDLIKNKT